MKFIQSLNKFKRKSDEQLLSEFIGSNNNELLGELYSRYLHLVYGVCLKYFKDPELSKDAVITIFEKIYIEIPKHQIKNFKSWLYVVTKNYCLMEIRKKKNDKIHVHIDNIVSNKIMENGNDVHPIDGNMEKDLEIALNNCIEKLKEEQKKCITLFYYKNKCYNEISQELNFTEKKVKSYIQNGKRNLKICLEKNK